MTPEQLVEQLKRSLGARLRSVVLYGSATTGEFLPGVSNYNLLVIADRFDVATLTDLAASIARWVREGHRPPLLFTPGQLEASADSFAIEVLDIQQSRQVLFGVDPVANLQVSPEHLRLQLEREFQGKLLALREGYLLTGGKPRRVVALLTSTLSGILVVFRAALRLFRESVPASKLDALRLLADQVGFDAEPWLTVEALKRESRSIRRIDASGLFESCLQVLEQVSAAVDRHLQSSEEKVER
jgi:hypothetical protein